MHFRNTQLNESTSCCSYSLSHSQLVELTRDLIAIVEAGSMTRKHELIIIATVLPARDGDQAAYYEQFRVACSLGTYCRQKFVAMMTQFGVQCLKPAVRFPVGQP